MDASTIGLEQLGNLPGRLALEALRDGFQTGDNT